MSLEEKIERANEIIKSHCEDSIPIVMSSFGKDSMVMLDLIKNLGFRFPILFFKEPFFPKKYEFANWVILNDGYTVYDYPPIITGVAKRNGSFEIINLHQITDNPLKTIYLPTGIVPPKEFEDYLCALEDIYNKPKGSYQFPWDTIFIGHKSSDKDPVLGGTVRLNCDAFTTNGKTFVFPLRDFTDSDVWEYTLAHELPINHKRYNKDNNWKEFEDITYNPDYFHACTACIDKGNPKEVFCPKIKHTILNISKDIPFIEADLSHYTTIEEK